MSQNIEQLLAKAKEVGSSTIPAGGGSSPEIQQALKKVFEANPKAWFTSKALEKALKDSGYEVSKIGNDLFAMKKRGEVQSPKKSIYGFNDGVALVKANAPAEESTEDSNEE